MDKRIRVLQYQILWFMRRAKRKICKKGFEFSHYAGKEIINLQEANDFIRSNIAAHHPFMVGRFGSIELEATWIFDFFFWRFFWNKQRCIREMKNNTGFFPEDMEYLKRFSEVMKNSCEQLDLLGVWLNPMEDYMVETYGNQCKLIPPRALEPWYVKQPWTEVLEGMKVLVIHPFVDTIQKQYSRRELLFEDKAILPQFKQLYALKAVQSIGEEVDERFQNWFEALEWMYQEAMKIDFDVAIVGCGAYGFPLAAKIKKAGKQAVQMGGATQILFGIKGKRWDNHPIISKLYNEYWVRPDVSEIPKGADRVEGGCYW